MSAQLPLQGIVVVDESQGPFAGLATMVLADFGAEVIKLEPAGGDPARALPGARLWLRGKHSVVLAEGDAAGRAAAEAILLGTPTARALGEALGEGYRTSCDAALEELGPRGKRLERVFAGLAG